MVGPSALRTAEYVRVVVKAYAPPLTFGEVARQRIVLLSVVDPWPSSPPKLSQRSAWRQQSSDVFASCKDSDELALLSFRVALAVSTVVLVALFEVVADVLPAVLTQLLVVVHWHFRLSDWSCKR
jgi:hypothetical protein